MPTHIEEPTVVAALGEPPKLIRELVGRIATKTEQLSIARMTSPPGWSEPAQRPDFDEYTVVISGTLHVASKEGEIDVEAGQALIAHAGELVRYSTPRGAEYIAICLPAFTPESAHRQE